MADEGKSKPGDVDPEAPPSADEVAASQRLRDALEDPSVPGADAELARSLRAAWRPEPIEDHALDAIVETSLSPDEARAAAELRRALEGDAATTPEAELASALASALACAWRPRALADLEHAAIIDRALGANVITLRRRTTVIRVTFGVAGVLAVAASVLLVVRPGQHGAREAPLALARSTQPLFAEPFRAGDASARIDRIAMARSADFRDNRFAKWGVR